MQPSEFLGRRMLHSEAQAYVERVRKLIDADREFTLTIVKFLLQAIITGKVS